MPKRLKKILNKSLMTGLNKKWQIATPAPKKFFTNFPEYHWIISQLFYNRGLKTEEMMENFLQPEFLENLADPFLMPGMKKGIKRIVAAIKKQEKILIYGDYDCDGITATTILYETLKYLGTKNLDFYLPDRDKEGYGIGPKALEKIINRRPNLVITVDCGVANYEPILELKKNNIPVIVSDHHTIQKDLPPALAIIHPRFKNSHYPFSDLSGAGIAFKVAQALLLGQNYPSSKSKNTRLTFLKWLLDLAAIGTVADCVDLLGENRVIVKYGLIVLNKTKRAGLKALSKSARLEKGRLNSHNIAFQIAPRLNAAGRMDHANSAFFLINEDSEQKANELAEKLEKQNSNRQQIVEKIVTQALEKFSRQPNDLLFIAKDKTWPIGVAGLAASRVLEKTSRPVLICEDTEGLIKCSARSIEKFNIIKAITQCSSLLAGFGGHSQAAGLSLAKINWLKFVKKIQYLVKKKLTKKDLVVNLKLEAKIKASDINWELVEQLEKFAPFGEANSTPRFCITGLKIKNLKTVGNSNKHLKLNLFDPVSEEDFDAIGFGLGGAKIKVGDKVKIAGELEFNEWNARKKIQIKIIDIMAIKTNK